MQYAKAEDVPKLTKQGKAVYKVCHRRFAEKIFKHFDAVMATIEREEEIGRASCRERV